MADDPLREYGHLFHEYANPVDDRRGAGRWWEMVADEVLARSERFELPTLGFEVRCSIQLSYERLRGLDYQTWPQRATQRKSLKSGSPWPGLVSFQPGRGCPGCPGMTTEISPGHRAERWWKRDEMPVTGCVACAHSRIS